MTRDQSIVITGSSRGIGFGLADSFLKRECSVVVSGSSENNTRIATQKLQQNYSSERIFAYACDVRDYQQIQALWDNAFAYFGKVDIWINNAGLSGPVKPIWLQKPDIAETVIKTNITGLVMGSIIALKGMLAQGFGAIYNMEGMGSDGRRIDGLTLYGTTKYGQKYFNDAISKEIKDTSVIIGSIRPGMVATDLIIKQYQGKPEEWQRVKGIFNIIADRVENVTPWIADKILENKVNGARFNYLTPWKMLWRTISMPFIQRDVFRDLGL